MSGPGDQEGKDSRYLKSLQRKQRTEGKAARAAARVQDQPAGSTAFASTNQSTVADSTTVHNAQPPTTLIKTVQQSGASADLQHQQGESSGGLPNYHFDEPTDSIEPAEDDSTKSYPTESQDEVNSISSDESIDQEIERDSSATLDNSDAESAAFDGDDEEAFIASEPFKSTYVASRRGMKVLIRKYIQMVTANISGAKLEFSAFKSPSRLICEVEVSARRALSQEESKELKLFFCIQRLEAIQKYNPDYLKCARPAHEVRKFEPPPSPTNVPEFLEAETVSLQQQDSPEAPAQDPSPPVQHVKLQLPNVFRPALLALTQLDFWNNLWNFVKNGIADPILGPVNNLILTVEHAGDQLLLRAQDFVIVISNQALQYLQDIDWLQLTQRVTLFIVEGAIKVISYVLNYALELAVRDGKRLYHGGRSAARFLRKNLGNGGHKAFTAAVRGVKVLCGKKRKFEEVDDEEKQSGAATGTPVAFSSSWPFTTDTPNTRYIFAQLLEQQPTPDTSTQTAPGANQDPPSNPHLDHILLLLGSGCEHTIATTDVHLHSQLHAQRRGWCCHWAPRAYWLC